MTSTGSNGGFAQLMVGSSDIMIEALLSDIRSASCV